MPGRGTLSLRLSLSPEPAAPRLLLFSHLLSPPGSSGCRHRISAWLSHVEPCQPTTGGSLPVRDGHQTRSSHDPGPSWSFRHGFTSTLAQRGYYATSLQHHEHCPSVHPSVTRRGAPNRNIVHQCRQPTPNRRISPLFCASAPWLASQNASKAFETSHHICGEAFPGHPNQGLPYPATLPTADMVFSPVWYGVRGATTHISALGS
jgi:hypothetical protein